MSLEYRNTAKKNISNSFRGILRVSPDSLGNDIGFNKISEPIIVTDSLGNESALSLSKNKVKIDNLEVPGNTELGNTKLGNTEVNGSINIKPKDNVINITNNSNNNIQIDVSTPENGDVFIYENGKYINTSLRDYIVNLINIHNPILPGTIMIWSTNEIPEGWLLCDGQEVSKTDYPNLYNRIKDIFGTPSNSNNFVLPDFRGTIPKGVNHNNERTVTVELPEGMGGITKRVLGLGESIGQFQQAKLPAIYGRFVVDDYVYLYNHIGCFRRGIHNNSTVPYYDAASKFEVGNFQLEFDAFESSPLYNGNARDFSPDTLAVNFIIKY